MNPTNDFEYLLCEVFGKPTPEDPNAKKVNELLNHMEDIDIGSVDRVNLKNNSVYFKAHNDTPKQVLIPYTKAFKKIGWTLYVRWQYV